MTNQTGANQFGGAEVQPQYGDVQKQTQLTRSAPMSGAPVATSAIQAPRRAGKAATRPQRAPKQSAQQEPAPPPVLPQQAPQGLPPVALHGIATIPGASPLVQLIFGGNG